MVRRIAQDKGVEKMTYFDSAVSKGFKGIASAKKSIAFGLVQLDDVSKVLDYDSSRESSLSRKDV